MTILELLCAYLPPTLYMNVFLLPVFLYLMMLVFLNFFSDMVTEPIETPSFEEISLDVNHLALFLHKKSYTSCCPILSKHLFFIVFRARNI